jgi:hypothetical protein
MKTPDLIQSRMFNKAEFTLETDGISVSEKNLSRSKKTHIYFENIPPKPSELTTSAKKVFIGAIAFTLLAVVCLPLAFAKKAAWSAPAVWVVVAAIFWIGFYFSKKSLIRFVQNGSGINLHRNKPSENAVEEFIEKMFQSRNAYLLKNTDGFRMKKFLITK